MSSGGNSAPRRRYGAAIATLGLMLPAWAAAQVPVITLVPLTPLPTQLASNAVAVVQYQVTNNSAMVGTWVVTPIAGVVQLTATAGDCAAPMVLVSNQSCVLDLQLNGSQMGSGVHGGPIVCKQGNPLQCYQPAAANQLDVTIVAPPDTIFVDGFE